VRYNVIANNKLSTITNAIDGLSQELFDCGVRIIKHDLSIQEAQAWIINIDREFLYKDAFMKSIVPEKKEYIGVPYKKQIEISYDSRPKTPIY
jgi:hypothetical protein